MATVYTGQDPNHTFLELDLKKTASSPAASTMRARIIYGDLKSQARSAYCFYGIKSAKSCGQTHLFSHCNFIGLG